MWEKTLFYVQEFCVSKGVLSTLECNNSCGSITDAASDRFLQPGGCQSEECLESDIQDILKEAQKTLREFTESMGFTNLNFDDQRGRRSREAANEVLLVTTWSAANLQYATYECKT